MPYDVQTMRAVAYDYTSRSTLRGAIPQLVEQLKRIKIPIQPDNPLQNALKLLEQSRPEVLPPATPSPRNQLLPAISSGESVSNLFSVRNQIKPLYKP